MPEDPRFRRPLPEPHQSVGMGAGAAGLDRSLRLPGCRCQRGGTEAKRHAEGIRLAPAERSPTASGSDPQALTLPQLRNDQNNYSAGMISRSAPLPWIGGPDRKVLPGWGVAGNSPGLADGPGATASCGVRLIDRAGRALGGARKRWREASGQISMLASGRWARRSSGPALWQKRASA